MLNWNIKYIGVYLMWMIIPLLTAGLLIVAACGNDECYENKNSLPLAGFYSSDSVPAAISLSAVTIYGIGVPGDSILHDSVSGLTETYLPFRIDEDNTSFVIKYLEENLAMFDIADTITFDYECVPWFVSAACGAIYKYKMNSISTTHHVIDSVTCPSGEIDNTNAENLRIYFRVSTSE